MNELNAVELLADARSRVAISKANNTFNIEYKRNWKTVIELFFDTPVEAEAVAWVKQEWRLPASETFKYEQRLKVIEFLGKYPQNADDFVSTYAEKMNIEIRLDCIKTKHSICSLSELKNDLYAYNIDFNLRIDRQRLIIAVDKWHDFGLMYCLFAMSQSVLDREAHTQGRPRNIAAEKELDKVIAIIDANVDRRDTTKRVIQHFIWNVKRVMDPFERKGTKNPIMPVLVGLTGNGKSTAIEYFLSPLANGGYTKTEFDKLLDPNHYNQSATIPVAFLDEMARMNVVDQNKLKAFITTDTVVARRMYTQEIETKAKIIQPIGTSNHSLSSISTDTTSSRRFYEIATPDDMKTAHPFWFKEIDWILIWKSVNPYGPDPLTDKINDALFAIQHNEQRKKNYVEEWLDEAQKNGTFRAGELYEEWYAWAEKHDRYHFQRANSTNFGRTLNASAGVIRNRDGKGVKYTVGVII
jgi:hypothetical protein